MTNGMIEWPAPPDGPDGSPPRSGEALDALVPVLYHELRAIAHRQLAGREAGRPGGATLVTTALVHEAYLKLAAGVSDGAPAPWRDRPHFLATAAVAMRQILVDRARARVALKRGGACTRLTLDEQAVAVDDEPEALLEIDDALTRLAALSPRLARVVECRFYAGMTEEEIAAAFGITVRTVQRDWVKARLLLQRALAA
jgi:RNA polymerase sigma factor (TIGR02999 family)